VTLKKNNFLMWGSLVAALLWAFAGLRDVFAPGFLSMSGRVAGSSNIAIEFVIAAMFFVLAGSSSRTKTAKLP
jgi:hypothetical protein